MTSKKSYTKIRLFIASPGDVTPERDRLLKIVQEFNQPNGFLDEIGVTLQPLDWRSHVAPLMGRPEAVVLEQLPVESWDIFVGIMWSRFGTATGAVDPQTGFSFDSGTEEEFTLAYHAWQQKQRPEILFYRCMRPIPPRNLNIDQYQRLEAFFQEFSPEGKHPGFVQEFESTDDFASRVRLDLERLLLKLRPASEPPPVSAVQTVAHEPARQRYLETMIKTHQHLPVAGFETNLRIPIPLEKVYITLKARMNELEHARGALDSPAHKRGSVRHKTSASSVEPLTDPAQPDQTVNVQQALQFALQRDYDGLVLLGYPGAGKTTLTKYFLLCFAGNKAEQQLGLSRQLLPILLSLRDIDPEQPLTANILASLQKYHLDLSEEFFLHYLQAGRAILLLDGLDEVPTEKKRALVSQWIHHQAHLAFPKCPVLVTSRFSGYRGEAILPGYYLRLEIQDYGMPEVQQFLENWLIGVETHVQEDNEYWRSQAKSRAENLFQRIEAAPALRELAVNPLMLQIIALVHRDRGTLPERRVELYKECTDVLLERWDKAKGLEVLLSAAQARQLLQPIALWMHSVENRREVSKAELLTFMQPHLGRIKREVDPEELLQNWQERSGIFKGEGDTYFFHHLSFQEYLTAEEIRNTRQADIARRRAGGFPAALRR
ncbi:NACHT domain-containing protein [candidate division KSB1 bacterium]|nr:NACHT domain-containing protein [candidate division KSB1 bacterium]